MYWLRVNIMLHDTTNPGIMSHRWLELYDNWRCLDKTQAVVGKAMCTACDTCRHRLSAQWIGKQSRIEAPGGRCRAMQHGQGHGFACQHSRHLEDTFQSAGDASTQAFLPEHIVIALAGPVCSNWIRHIHAFHKTASKASHKMFAGIPAGLAASADSSATVSTGRAVLTRCTAGRCMVSKLT